MKIIQCGIIHPNIRTGWDRWKDTYILLIMSSNQPITLTYFKGWGLAEQCRWVLASHPSSSSFENICLSTYDEFDSLLSSGELLFGQLPLLSIDGMKLVQSQTLVRYVAKRNDMQGGGIKGQARADMVAELVKDVRLGVVKWPFSEDKKEHLNTIVYPLLNRWLPVLERVLISGGGYASGEGSLCYADVLIGLVLQAYGEMFASLSGGIFEDVFESEGGFVFEHLKKCHREVVNIKGVKDYLESELRWPFPAEGDICDSYVENVKEVLGRR